jgi:hypothetical protein
LFFETLQSNYNDKLVYHCNKAQERTFYTSVKLRLEGRNPQRGTKAKRGTTNKIRVKPLCFERIFQMHIIPGILEFIKQSSIQEIRGAERNESCGGYWKGKTSESLNLMDGFGMKQGREGKRGIKTSRG